MYVCMHVCMHAHVCVCVYVCGERLFIIKFIARYIYQANSVVSLAFLISSFLAFSNSSLLELDLHWHIGGTVVL